MAGIYMQALEIESELTDFVPSDENATVHHRRVFPKRLTLIGAACGTLALAFVTLLYPSGSGVTAGSAVISKQEVCADDQAGYRNATGNKHWTCKFHGDHGGCDIPQSAGKNVVPSKWCRKSCGICGCADHLDGYRKAAGQKKWTCKFYAQHGGCDKVQKKGNNVLPSEWCFESCGRCAKEYKAPPNTSKHIGKYMGKYAETEIKTNPEACIQSCQANFFCRGCTCDRYDGGCTERRGPKLEETSNGETTYALTNWADRVAPPPKLPSLTASKYVDYNNLRGGGASGTKITYTKFPGIREEYNYKDCTEKQYENEWVSTFEDESQPDGWYWNNIGNGDFQYQWDKVYKCEKLPKGKLYKFTLTKGQVSAAGNLAKNRIDTFDVDTYWWNYYNTYYYWKDDGVRKYWKTVKSLGSVNSRAFEPNQK